MTTQAPSKERVIKLLRQVVRPYLYDDGNEPLRKLQNEGIEGAIALLESSSLEPPPEQEPRSFSPWRVPDPPRVNVAEALRPFVELFEKSNERYRQRGGDLGQFRDTHPFREITAKELPLGVWRRAQAVLRASQPQFACPVCNQMLPSRDVVHDCPAPPPGAWRSDSVIPAYEWVWVGSTMGGGYSGPFYHETPKNLSDYANADCWCLVAQPPRPAATKGEG